MPESGFEIDGERYEIPRLDTITLDEERVLYIYSDTVLQDFLPAHPDDSEDEKLAYQAQQARKIRNPDFKRALAHVAYRREHPDVSDADINAAIGKVGALSLDIALLRGDDDSPPATNSQNEPEKSSKRSGPEKSTGSGRPTEIVSDLQAETPEATGTIESETSSPGAPLTAVAR